MDIELILDVLDKHGITNIQLAEDLQTLAKECYLDGKFDEATWWMFQDEDGEWISEWDFDTEEEIVEYGDIPYNPQLMDEQDLPPGSPFDRSKDDGEE